MTGNDLLRWIDFAATAAASFAPGSKEALMAVAIVKAGTEALRALIAGEVKDGDLQMPKFDQLYAEVEAQYFKLPA